MMYLPSILLTPPETFCEGSQLCKFLKVRKKYLGRHHQKNAEINYRGNCRIDLLGALINSLISNTIKFVLTLKMSLAFPNNVPMVVPAWWLHRGAFAWEKAENQGHKSYHLILAPKHYLANRQFIHFIDLWCWGMNQLPLSHAPSLEK